MTLLEIAFCILFVFCGCGADSICDKSGGIWMFIAFMVLFLVAGVMGHRDD